MKFKPTTSKLHAARRRSAGFTLAEVLAALVFMAIVIPVAIEGLRVASLAGEVADRKSSAARIAQRMLNEVMVTGQWKSSAPGGDIEDPPQTYHWKVKAAPWEKDTLQVVTVEVTFAAQGRNYEVRLSTLADTSVQ